MVTNIEHIKNGEQGLSVREKLNSLIDLAIGNARNIESDHSDLMEAMSYISMLLSNGAKYKGVAEENTDLRIKEDSVFYVTRLREKEVTYRNLGGVKVPAGDVGVIVYQYDAKSMEGEFRFEALLTFDRRPQEDSLNPVTSKGIKEAIDEASVSKTEIGVTAREDRIIIENRITFKGGDRTEGSNTLPLATESLSGLLSPTDKKQIRLNKEDIVTEISDRKEADTELQKMVEENVLYFELNESTGEIVATTGGESVYKSITMSEDTGEIEVEQEV